MAANKTRIGLNNQKRGVCVAKASFVEADILLTGAELFVLPDNCIITKVLLDITTVSGTATATLDVVANGVVVANEVAATAAAVVDATLVNTATKLLTGGTVVLLAGAVTPADGALIGNILIEYIELDKVTGEYTGYSTT